MVSDSYKNVIPLISVLTKSPSPSKPVYADVRLPNLHAPRIRFSYGLVAILTLARRPGLLTHSHSGLAKVCAAPATKNSAQERPLAELAAGSGILDSCPQS